MSQPATVLADRYGGPPPARRPLVVAVAVLLAGAGAVWLAWVVAFHGRPQVTSEMVSYDVTREHAASARFTVVRRDVDVRATCLLRAVAADHAVVGEQAVAVGAGRPETTTVTATMRVERRATTVDLLGCTTPGQRQPR